MGRWRGVLEGYQWVDPFLVPFSDGEVGVVGVGRAGLGHGKRVVLRWKRPEIVLLPRNCWSSRELTRADHRCEGGKSFWSPWAEVKRRYETLVAQIDYSENFYRRKEWSH